VGRALCGSCCKTGAEHAIAAGRDAAETAQELGRWCLADGMASEAVVALERGRALALLAASSGSLVAERLDAAGEHELADRWRRSEQITTRITRRAGVPLVSNPAGCRTTYGTARSTCSPAGRTPTASCPRQTPPPSPRRCATSLWTRSSICRLPDGSRARRLRSAPAPDGGALVLRPDGDIQWVPLRGLALAPGGVVGRYLLAQAGAVGDVGGELLTDICTWAWDVAVEPLLPVLRPDPAARPPRVVLVPGDALAIVPWQAAHPRRTP